MLLKEKVAITEIGLFIPLFFQVLFVAFRRRSIKQLQWIFLPLACLTRIISAALDVASSRTKNNLSNDAKKTVIVDNVVLCFLLLTHLQFLIGMYVLILVLVSVTPIWQSLILTSDGGTLEITPRHRPISAKDA